MPEASESSKPGIIKRAVEKVRTWASGVREDAKAAPGLIKDIGSIAAQAPVMPTSGERNYDWRDPNTVVQLPNTPESQPTQAPHPLTTPSK